MLTLYIEPTDPRAAALYSAAASAYLAKPVHERDAGFDTFVAFAQPGKKGSTERLHLGCRAAVYDHNAKRFTAFWLLPRSSISKSPLRMANSVGLIDAGYRGPIMAAVDILADCEVQAGDRYFQIVGPALQPWTTIQVLIDSEIPGGTTLRGEGGFGSTGLRSSETSMSSGSISSIGDNSGSGSGSISEIGYFV